MVRRGADHHKPRKQKRSVQTVVCPAVWMVERHPPVVQGSGDEGQPPTVLAPHDPSVEAFVWTLWRVEFIHVRHSTRSAETLRLWLQPSSVWSVGEGLARKHGTIALAQRLKKKESVHDYALISISYLGVDPDQSETKSR